LNVAFRFLDLKIIQNIKELRSYDLFLQVLVVTDQVTNYLEPSPSRDANSL